MKREMELTQPGEMLKIETVEGLNLSIAEAANLLAITRSTLPGILCGKAKSYISRIEDDALDIRPSMLTKIIQKSLGGHLKLTLQVQKVEMLANEM